MAPTPTGPRAGERRAEGHRSGRHRRSAARMRAAGVVRNTTRCPVCTGEVGVGEALLAHLETGCASN